MTGKQLKTLLDTMEISQGELASHLGYTRHAINKWIVRNIEIPRPCVPQICNYFTARLRERQKKHSVVLDILGTGYGRFERKHVTLRAKRLRRAHRVTCIYYTAPNANPQI